MNRHFRWTALLVVLVWVGRPVIAADPTRAQQFVVMGYEGIQKDLATGDGPYLRSLLELLQIPTDHRAQTLEKIRILAKKELNILVFSEQVASLQFHLTPSASVATPSEASLPEEVVVPLPARSHLYQGDALKNALEHLARGMRITVYLKSGEKTTGTVVEYAHERLRLRGAGNLNFKKADIQAIESSDL